MVELASAFASVIAVVDAGVFAYGAYWASEIRAALATPLYRRQALWVAAIAFYFAVFFVFVVITRIFGVEAFSGSPVPRIAAGAFVYVGVLMIFVWIDSCVKVARRSDPLRRDSLRWSSLRWLLGFLVVVGTFFALGFTPALSFTQATPIFGPIGLTLFIGAIVLYLSGRRSADPVLRAHLRWFGLFMALLWVTSAVDGTNLYHSAATNPWVDAISYLVFWVSAYFLYRSIKDLAPLAPLPPTGKYSSRVDAPP